MERNEQAADASSSVDEVVVMRETLGRRWGDR